jgi:hypothetical protein
MLAELGPAFPIAVASSVAVDMIHLFVSRRR